MVDMGRNGFFLGGGYMLRIIIVIIILVIALAVLFPALFGADVKPKKAAKRDLLTFRNAVETWCEVPGADHKSGLGYTFSDSIKKVMESGSGLAAKVKDDGTVKAPASSCSKIRICGKGNTGK
ncbi:MAG: hypothetical protein SVS85_00765, partial [Candidatus Nanohaloarchaea archaeon]|nr:hypothetical protein [Candidatus Nanohaloarchaea archaeon]